MSLTQAVKDEARRLGFALAGVTTPEPPPHASVYENWLNVGRHGQMGYLADECARARRLNPRLILPECQSILILAMRYSNPISTAPVEGPNPTGRVAAYAWGSDYHIVLPARLKTLVAFIERQTGGAVANRWYTDTGPVLERDLAQRAGLGWIGKNTCLIHPEIGSYLLLSEILLEIKLETDPPFLADRCGTCTRCLDACPTGCILPDRTIDARRCISYQTIENKHEIPPTLRPLMGNWIFGCDICQMVCPWNQSANSTGDSAFTFFTDMAYPNLIAELTLTSQEFNRKFKDSPVKRAKRRGYLRNVAVALGNSANPVVIPALEKALQDAEPVIHEHADWALHQIKR